MEKTILKTMIDEIVEDQIENRLTQQEIIYFAYLGLAREIQGWSNQDIQDEWDDTIGKEWNGD